MAPARRRKHIGQPLPPAQITLAGVTGNANIFVRQHGHRVERVQLLDQAIDGRIIGALGLERAEQPVPDDQRAGIIRIEIARVGAVVHAMVRRRVEDRFIPTRHPVDRFGVQEELVRRIQHPAERDHDRIEANQHQRDLEHHRAGEMLGP